MDTYEKKYKELEFLVKNLYPTMTDYQKEKVAGVLPELAESEDERMINALIQFTKENQYKETVYKGVQISKNTFLAYLEKQKEQKPPMIQWTGKNLKEVIGFTGKNSKFGEWFKSWEDFENYVHSHGDILKLFCEDGSHYEVPVGAWIIKTPDGYNIPSRFKLIQKPVEWSEDTQQWIDCIIKGFEDELNKDRDHRATIEAKISVLKSLRPQPQGVYKQIVHNILYMIDRYESLGYDVTSDKTCIPQIRAMCKTADECHEILDEPS